MALRIRQIVLDARDVPVVSEFWSALLDWPTERLSDHWISMTDGTIKLAVQSAPDHEPPDWPDPQRSQQVHIDIPVPDIEEAEALVLRLGGVKLAERPEEVPAFRIYADPAGHTFCLEYHDVTQL